MAQSDDARRSLEADASESIGNMQVIPEGALAYTVEQAAHVCGLSRHSIYAAIKSGDLKAKRTKPGTDYAPPSGKIIILRRHLEAFLESLPDDYW